MNYFEAMISDEERARLPYIPTISQLLGWVAGQYPQQIAAVDDRERLTYAGLAHRVACKRAVLERTIPAGAHVGVLCRNTVDAMCWFLAVPTSGRVLMMLPWATDREALSGIITKFDLQALVLEERFQPLAEGVGLPVIPAGACDENPVAAAEVGKDDPAAIFFTGGSTGVPKGAVLSHGALMRGAHNGAYRPAGTVFGNRTILILPMSHIFGAVAGFLSMLYTGTEIHCCGDVKRSMVSIPAVRPTCLVLVPGMVEIILGLAASKGEGFVAGLKTIICGAAPVPVRLMTEMRKYGISLFAGYGMTEAANLTTGNIDTDTKPHSMGKFYPQLEHRVVDGELWIRGDCLMQGYYRDPDLTAQVMTPDGWLKTGDLVSIDPEGYITIEGRIKNLIILPNGENVSPEQLEEIFCRSGMIRDCLVKEGRINGKPVLALEVLPLLSAFPGMGEEEMETMLREEIRRINAGLPSYKQVGQVTIRHEDFRRTGAMKIDRLHT